MCAYMGLCDYEVPLQWKKKKKNFFLTMCQFSNYQWHDGSLGCHQVLNMFLQGADKSWYLADICDAT